ncbi:MAG: hypothetical protein KIT18_05745 [Burkholderiales bacterium]|nr:hypothetical protein [Burkholderiales bacterium]
MRYVRATVLTALAVATVPAAFFAIALWEFHSPAWDPTDDSGAVQGFALLGVAAAVAVGGSATVFPLVGRFLLKAGSLTTIKFLTYSAACLVLIALAISVATVPLLGLSLERFATLVHILTVSAILVTVAAALALPFCWLWLRLAGLPHNSTPNSDARKNGARGLA